MSHEKKIAELLEIIEKSPGLLAERNRAREETLQRRKQAADALASLEKSWETEAKRLDKAVASRKSAVEDALKKIEGLRCEHAQAYSERMAAGYRFDADSLEQRRILLETCDPAIDEAVQFFRERIDWLRRTERYQAGAELDEPRNFFGQIMETVLFKKRRTTNAVAILKAMVYCRDCIRELESMRLLPECNPERIEGLRRSIPSIDRFSPAMEFPKKSPITGELELAS